MPDHLLRVAMGEALIAAGLRYDGQYPRDGENIQCFWPEALAALALDPDLMDLEPGDSLRQVAEAEVTVEHGTVALHDLLDHLSIWSTVPACRAYWTWMCREYIPVILRSGYYDPAHNHEPPPGTEIAALEYREYGRDLLDALCPGLGHLV